MNKFWEKTVATLCAATMVVSACAALAACGDDKDPEKKPGENQVKITDGIFRGRHNTDTSGGFLTNMCRFNEDGTYYRAGMGSQTNGAWDWAASDAGTYELKNKSVEYYTEYAKTAEGNNEGEQPVESSKKTASQVVVFTSYTGGTAEVIYDNDKLFAVEWIPGNVGYTFLDHEAEEEYKAEDWESDIIVEQWYANNDEMASLVLYHTKKFTDLTGDSSVRGTWSKNGAVYTLTPENGAAYTFTPNGDTASLKKGEEETTLRNRILGTEVIATFATAEDVTISGVPSIGTADAPVTVLLRQDLTCEIHTNIFNNDVLIDSGTYTEDLSGQIPAYSFNFTHVGKLTAKPDYSSAHQYGITLNLTVTATNVPCTALGNEMNASFTAVCSYAYTTKKEVAAFELKAGSEIPVTGLPLAANVATLKLTLYSNNECELILTIDGPMAAMFGEIMLDEGTYAAAGSPFPTYTFTFEKAGELVSAADMSSATTTGINIELVYSVTNAHLSVAGGAQEVDVSIANATLVYQFVVG